MIRILIADDSPDDAEQCIQALREAKEPVRTCRVTSTADLRNALATAEWDALLADHAMAQMSVAVAISTVRDQKLDIPVIVLARKIPDMQLQQVMADGARDVIVKGLWARLLPALRRELQAAADRRSSARVSESMRRLEDRYRVMIEGSQEAVCYCHDGMYVDANPAYLALVDYHDIGELKGVPILNLVEETERARLKSQLRSPDSFRDSREYTAITRSGTRIAVEIAVAGVNIESEPCVQVIVIDISKRKELESSLQFLHQRDVLTGLCNRPYFLQELGRAMDCARDSSSSFLIGLELHGMREINEALGHTACDRLLCELARELGNRVNAQQLVGRVGGGQFAVLLPATSRAQATAVLQVLREMSSGFRFPQDREHRELRFELELVEINGPAGDRQKLLGSAFCHIAPAHPAAAAGPRLRPVASSGPGPAPAAAATHHGMLDPVLQDAVSKERFHLLFQPLINLRGEPRQYYEACLYLETENGTMLPSAQFMPAVEKAGFANRVDRWVVQRSITALGKCGGQQARAELFVPLSGSAVADPMLLPAIQQHVKAMRLSPARLHLQIPGEALKQYGDGSLSFLQRITDAGIEIALDDYDPAMFDAQQLAEIPANFIKINCALARCADEAVLRHAASDARACSKQSVAARVEDMTLFALLWNCGLDYVQGESLSPPASEMNYNFESEQTLTSDRPPANPWQAHAV